MILSDQTQEQWPDQRVRRNGNHRRERDRADIANIVAIEKLEGMLHNIEEVASANLL